MTIEASGLAQEHGLAEPCIAGHVHLNGRRAQAADKRHQLPELLRRLLGGGHFGARNALFDGGVKRRIIQRMPHYFVAQTGPAATRPIGAVASATAAGEERLARIDGHRIADGRVGPGLRSRIAVLREDPSTTQVQK